QAFFKALLVPDFLRLETSGRAVVLSLEDANPLATAIPSGAELAYAGAFPGVDLGYQMLPDAVKESIVLADASAPTEYHFRLSAADGDPLQAEARPDGSWRFSGGSGAPLFSLAVPFAVDAAQTADH